MAEQRKSRVPQGRPWTNVRALARQHTAEALESLVELMHDPNSCVALPAARAVLEWGHGKVPVRLKHMGKPRKPKPAKPAEPNVIIKSFREGSGDAD